LEIFGKNIENILTIFPLLFPISIPLNNMGKRVYNNNLKVIFLKTGHKKWAL